MILAIGFMEDGDKLFPVSKKKASLNLWLAFKVVSALVMLQYLQTWGGN